MSGTLRKYSYDISIELGTLHLGVKFPCKVGIIWQTPLKTIQATNKPDLVNGKANLSQTLTNSFVLDFDMNKNVFLPRPATLKTLLYTEKGVREAGQVDFDLTTALNSRVNDLTGEYPLQKCPDKSAKISFNIKSILREEIKSVNNPSNLGNVMMPDIVMGVKPQQPVQIPSQINPPTSDGFKKKVRINQQIIIAPSTPQFGQQQHQQPDHYKNEREALINENTNNTALLLKAQTDNDHLRQQLRRSLEQKQDLYAQIESYNNEVNNLRAQNQQLRKMQQMFKQAQQELIKARTQLARIFNAATDLGGPALTDRLQSAVGIQEREY